MDKAKTGQVITSAADVYEEFFVPALFAEWAPRLAELAAIGQGHRVLDVACGTGILARAAAERAGPTGAVVGLDRNDGMLSTARRKAPGIDWRQGRAETLPFEAASFDAVASQFGLMFFDDRGAAIKEMWRVLRPGGRLVLAVWDTLENTPGYAAVAGILQRLFGEEVAGAIRTPYSLGERKMLSALLTETGIPDARIVTYEGTARFPSIDAWVHTDVKGWTLAEMIDDAQYARLLETARRELRGFADRSGAVSFPAPAHVASAVKVS
jgi:ubiquinone/menaquinone biosynthesis C-methylase UbiE